MSTRLLGSAHRYSDLDALFRSRSTTTKLHLVKTDDVPVGGTLPLARYEAACRAVAACVRFDEAKEIRNKAEAIRVYAKQINNPQLESDAWAIRKRAERRCGELSADLDKAQGARTDKLLATTGKKSKAKALADAGISTSSAHRYEKLARVPEDEWETLIAKGREQIAAGYSHADAIIKAAIKAKSRPPKLPPLIVPGPLAARMKIIHGNCLDMLPTIREPHILISDPPYNQRCRYDNYSDALPPDEYRNMLIKVFGGKACVIILYPEEIINLLGGGALGECQEVVAWVYPSNTGKQHRLVTWWNCKPDLTKLGQPYRNPNDKRIVKLIEEGFEARSYDWWGDIHQVKNVSKDHSHPCPIPVELARRIILTTTNPGDLIVDPYCGVFTIPCVAAALGRAAIGIDQSEKYCRIAEARLGTIMEELGLKDEAVYAEAAE